jgi:hypothetical protein
MCESLRPALRSRCRPPSWIHGHPGLEPKEDAAVHLAQAVGIREVEGVGLGEPLVVSLAARVIGKRREPERAGQGNERRDLILCHADALRRRKDRVGSSVEVRLRTSSKKFAPSCTTAPPESNSNKSSGFQLVSTSNTRAVSSSETGQEAVNSTAS